ncbi:MAG: hypothetical protein JO002_06090 [Burkholderiaceae bacterium]|nr:hypothetical protein [Burkholderiaceae bacterium]
MFFGACRSRLVSWVLQAGGRLALAAAVCSSGAIAEDLQSFGPMAFDASGNLYIAGLNLIQKRTVGGDVSRVAGSGLASADSFSGDGGPARNAAIGAPRSIAVDSQGDIYFADAQTSRVRRISHDTGIVTTVAGSGVAGFAGDGGLATAAALNAPSAVAIDRQGNLYIADTGNDRIRKVTRDGVIHTFAGDGTDEAILDGDTALNHPVGSPSAICIDKQDNLYVVDASRAGVYMISSNGALRVLAGGGKPRYYGDRTVSRIELHRYLNDSGPADRAQLIEPRAVAVDGHDNLYIADWGIVYRISPDGVIAAIAGNGKSDVGTKLGPGFDLGLPRFDSEGGPALGALLPTPWGLAAAPDGELYISDSNHHTLRKVSPEGVISTLVGDSAGPARPLKATDTMLEQPHGMVVGPDGTLYIAATAEHRIRMVRDGRILTLAGNGIAGFDSDSGTCGQARFNSPQYLALDRRGNLYVSDTGNQRVRKIALDSCTVTTVAGNGKAGYGGDGGPATVASLNQPAGLAVDGDGSLYIVDQHNYRVRRVLPDGVIATMAGSGVQGKGGDDGPASAATLFWPGALALDGRGGFYIGDVLARGIRHVTADGVIRAVAVPGLLLPQYFQPSALVTDGAGNLYVADRGDLRVYEFTRVGKTIQVAGAGHNATGIVGDGGPAAAAQIGDPAGLALSPTGGLYLSDALNGAVREISATGTIDTVAGNYGPMAHLYDGLPATGVPLNGPSKAVANAQGEVYFAESDACIVRKIARDGTLQTVAGIFGHCGYGGDGGRGDDALLSWPRDLAFDAMGNLYIADAGNNRVRKLGANGIITTVAGNGQAHDPTAGATVASALVNDGGPATLAMLSQPTGVAIDRRGDLYIADGGDHRIRKVDAAGTISTVAGTGGPDFSNESGLTTEASIGTPVGIAVDASGNVFFSTTDLDSNRILAATAEGRLKHVAGAAQPSCADAQAGGVSAFSVPHGLAADDVGNVYVADTDNHRIRKVAPDGTVTTIAGNGTMGSGGDGGPAILAELFFPSGVAVGSGGALYVTDEGNAEVRMISTKGMITTIAGNHGGSARTIPHVSPQSLRTIPCSR